MSPPIHDEAAMLLGFGILLLLGWAISSGSARETQRRRRFVILMAIREQPSRAVDLTAATDGSLFVAYVDLRALTRGGLVRPPRSSLSLLGTGLHSPPLPLHDHRGGPCLHRRRETGVSLSCVRPTFVECPTCAAKCGSPTLCRECLERRELHRLVERIRRMPRVVSMNRRVIAMVKLCPTCMGTPNANCPEHGR